MQSTLKLRLSSTIYDDEEDSGITGESLSVVSNTEAEASSIAAAVSANVSSQNSIKQNEIKTLEEKIMEYDDTIIPRIKQRIKDVESVGSSKQSSKSNARQSALQMQQDLFEMKVELELARAQRTFLFEELQEKKGG